MVNEEVSQRVVSVAFRMMSSNAREVMNSISQHMTRAAYRKGAQEEKQPSGKQSVKELLGQGGGVSTVDIDKEGLRDFQKMAKKYGVDFAIVKDKSSEKPIYTVFLKSKDAEGIAKLMDSYAAKGYKKEKTVEKPSILKKLAKFKDIASKTPHKKKHREERTK